MAKGKNISVALTGQSLTVAQGRVNATSFVPLPDKHQCYRLIGLITSECARIEHFLDAAIFEFAGLQSNARTGACITGQMVGMYPRYQALHQLAAEHGAPKPIQTEIKHLERLSAGVAKLRNRAVHDAWMQDTNSKKPHQFRTKAKKDTSYGPQPVTVAQLKKDLAEVRVHLERVMKFRSDVWEHHRPTP